MKKYLLILLLAIIFAQPAQSLINPSPLVAYRQEGVWHFLDSEGKQMFEPKSIKDVFAYNDGLFRVNFSEDNKIVWGFMDTKGEIPIKVNCDYLANFSDGYALIYKMENNDENNKKFGFINKYGKVIFDFVFDDATDFTYGMAYVMNSRMNGYMTPDGNIKIPLEKMAGNPFKEGLADVNTNDFKIGFIDTSGKTIIDFNYEETSGFSEGFAGVNIGGKLGYINKAGDVLVPPMYDNANPFHEGMAFVGKFELSYKSKWGLIDSSAKTILDFQFDKVNDFSDGVAAVQKDGLWGFIDKTGKYIIEPKFFFADSFVDGLAWVSDKMNSKAGFIDKSGSFRILIDNTDRIIDLRTNRQVFK